MTDRNVIAASKNTAATIQLRVDATMQMDSGEAVSSAVVESIVWSGTDASPSSMVSGAAATSGNIVTQNITGGLAGNIYLLRISLTTSTGNLKFIFVKLAVLSDTPFE